MKRVIFSISLVLVIGFGIGYYFYNKPNSLSDRAKIISEGYFDGISNIRKVATMSGCTYNNLDCVEYTNKTSSWESYVNYNDPIFLNDTYSIRVALKSDDGGAGLTLIGVPSLTDYQWWEGYKAIHIIPIYEKLALYIYDGSNEQGFELFNDEIKTDEWGFQNVFLVFDNRGTKFTLTDSDRKIIKIFDVKQITQNATDEIFPKKMIYTGFAVGPSAKISFSKLAGFPL